MPEASAASTRRENPGEFVGPAPSVPTIHDLEAARERLAGTVLRTPLVPLDADGPGTVHLKLESLQPGGSFKLRGAGNAVRMADPKDLSGGVWTASAGNMGLGLAWCARELGVACTVVLPEGASPRKREALARHGARIISAPADQWMDTYRTRRFTGLNGMFVHAFADPPVIAGNGTIGLEILDDLEDLDEVFVPWGGGGLACGIAAAVRARKPDVRVYACEVSECAPLAAALAAGGPVTLPHVRTFVDGIGAPWVDPGMFALATELLAGSLTVGLHEVAAAVRLVLERNGVLAEGAAATAVAAALSAPGASPPRDSTRVCVVSGGNLDAARLREILEGGIPA